MANTKKKMITVASLPAVQRDLFLSRSLRRSEDTPKKVETLIVEWKDMRIAFASDEAIAECSVDVKEDISLVTFTRRMESLLDCAAKSDSTEWVLKWSAKISTYGDVDYVRRVLCDKVASMDSKTGETVGVLKIKRRSVKSGHAKIRLVPADNSLQLVCRHTSAQGLKSVWKSVLWRLKPQYESCDEEASSTDQTSVSQVEEAAGPIMQLNIPQYYAGVELYQDPNDGKRELCQKAIKLPNAEDYLNSGIYPLSEMQVSNSPGSSGHGWVYLKGGGSLPGGRDGWSEAKVKGLKFSFKMFAKTLKGIDITPFTVKKTEDGFILTASFGRSNSGYGYEALKKATITAVDLGYTKFAEATS